MCIIISTTVNDQPYGKDYFFLIWLVWATKTIVRFLRLSRKHPPVLLLWLCILMGIFCSRFLPLFVRGSLPFPWWFFVLQWNPYCCLRPFHRLPSSPQKPKVKPLSRGNWILWQLPPADQKQLSLRLPTQTSGVFFELDVYFCKSLLRPDGILPACL